MMELNATLLVQVINFWVVYFVLKWWLLDDVVDDILQQRKEEKALLDEIEMRKREAEHFEQEREEQLIQFQKDVNVQMMPAESDRARVALVNEKPKRSELSSDEIAHLVQKVAKDVYGDRH